jgi:hypothetical protein
MPINDVKKGAARLLVAVLRTGCFLLLLLLVPCGAQAQELQFAELGQCALESGQVIEDCRIEYRTFGAPRGGGEIAVWFPTWFSGATENLVQFVGENKRWTSPSESEPTRLCSRALADISPQIASRKR